MPLVEYLGNATAQDNTEVINLNPAEDGSPRSISRGGRALVSGEELRALAANYQIRVIDDGDEQSLTSIPTAMPSGYQEDGYKEDEAHSDVVFTPEAYPDKEPPAEEVADVRAADPSSSSSGSGADSSAGSSAGTSSSSSSSAPSATPTPAPASPGSPVTPSAPASSAPSSAPDHSDTPPASPGASG